jgi:hypothetical protein
MKCPHCAEKAADTQFKIANRFCLWFCLACHCVYEKPK